MSSKDLLDRYKEKVTALENELSAVRARLLDERISLGWAEEEVTNVEQAQALVQTVAQQIQQQVHRHIASVVSRCLEAVFDEPYEFQIIFEQRRGRTEAELVFVRDGLTIDPMLASGGGVVDVASFALRLACLLLTRPPLQRVLVLDEPFKFVSAEYRDRLRMLLEMLAKEMQVQIIMVTHIPELRVGKVVEL